MSIEAMKQALEALEKLWDIIDDIDTYGDMAKADDKLYRSLVERRQRQRFETTGISTDGYGLSGGAITTLRTAIEAAEKREQALDKMAENSRELGLNYDPAGGTQVSKVWWDGDKLMAKPIPLSDLYTTPPAAVVNQQLTSELAAPVQEPISVILSQWKSGAIGAAEAILELFKHYPSKPSIEATPPAAQRQLVGLTDEEIDKLFGDGPYVPAVLLRDVARAIEAKLREKNGGQS